MPPPAAKAKTPLSDTSRKRAIGTISVRGTAVRRDARQCTKASLHLARLNLFCAHVWAQGLGDEHAAVEGVHELAALASFGAVANVGPPCLEALEVRAGRNLAEESLSGQPDLEIIGLRRAEAHVSGAEQHAAIVQPEPFEHRL